MDTLLGLLGVVVFIPAVITIAAVVTWIVVRLSPGTEFHKQPSGQP